MVKVKELVSKVLPKEEYQSLKLVMRLIAEIRWFEELNPRRRRNEL